METWPVTVCSLSGLVPRATIRWTLGVFLLLMPGVLLAHGDHKYEGTNSAFDIAARFTSITSCSSPSLSPDGKRLAFVADITGAPQVWMMPVEGGWPEQVTNLNDTIRFAQWSPDGKWLSVSAAPGGGMNSQVFLVSADGLEVKRITAGDKATNQLGPWSEDGRALGLSANTRNETTMDGYIYDLESGATRLAADIGSYGALVDFAAGTRRALVDKLEGRGSNDLYLFDVESGKRLLLTPHEGAGSFDGVLSKDGSTVYVASNKDRDQVAFGRIRVSSGTQGMVASEIEILRHRDDAGLESFSISHDQRSAALIWNQGGRSTLEIYDFATAKARPVAVPADLIGSPEWSRADDLLVLSVAGANLPRNIYAVDPKSGSGRMLTNCPHPGVSLDALIRPELIEFPAHDELTLSGWLYRPADQDTGAYVLSFHGGPEGQERPSLRADYQALLQSGIGVFAPNIRGSSGFGKKFVNLDNRELRFDANRDIESAANFLVEKGIAKKGRLGIMGGSYGGYAVMVAVTEYPDLFAAGVNLFGMVNFETFFAHTEPWMAAISGTEYGDPVTQKDLLRRLSPIHKLDQVKTPLLVLHGANDTNVPVVEAEQVVESLERRGVPVEYVLFPDEGHGFRKAPNRLTSTTETVNWFSRYLLPE